MIAEIQNKNHFVFRKLFEELYPELVRYANEYLFDLSSSEDLVQEVFVYLWENSIKISIKTSLKAYLYTTVRNRCLNILKKNKITDSIKILDIKAGFDTHYDPDLFLEDEKEILYEKLQKVIDGFPEKMQEIVKLRFVNNYKYSEIAEELQVSVNTVKTQLKRAKVKFGDLIIFIVALTLM